MIGLMSVMMNVITIGKLLMYVFILDTQKRWNVFGKLSV